MVAAGSGPSREPSALSSEPSAASQPASAPAGPNVPQVLPRSTLELKVRQSWWPGEIVIRVRRFLMVLGRRSAKVAPKRVLSAQDAFRDPKNIKKRRTRMEKCGLCHFGAKRAPTAPLERLGAFGPLRTPKTSDTYAKVRK